MGRAFSLVGATIPLLVALGCAGDPEPPTPRAAPETRREAPAGPVIGFVDRYGAHAYRGVPYAAPPVGARRWRPPEPARHFRAPRRALEHGPVCPQLASPLGGVADAEPGTVVGREDCLRLDLYAPAMTPEEADAAQLPVMVWIHGGGNTIGSSSFYHGGRLAAEQEVLVVMPNYRLGPLGWFRHPSLAAAVGEDAPAEARSGNWGLLDLIRVLEWVQENAPAFGGDPERVTIFGESAGGANVLALLASPPARGLFQRAIVQSGGVSGASVAEAENPADAARPGHRRSSAEVLRALLETTGVARSRKAALHVASTMEPRAVAAFLHARTPEELLSVYADGSRSGMIDLPRLIRDGAVIPEEGVGEALADGSGAEVPVILGSNRDETKLFLFMDPQHVRRWFGVLPQVRDRERYFREAEYGSLVWRANGVDALAGALARRRPGEIFAYRFDWDEEPRILWADLAELVGAAHGLEIPFVFGHWDLGREGRVLFSEDSEPGREALSAAMRGYWAAFARDGRPGRGGRADRLPWEPWDAEREDGPRTLILDTAQDGGLRMSPQTVSLEQIAERVRDDARFESREARCATLARAVEGSFRLGAEDYAQLAGGLCADIPFEVAAQR